METAKKGGIGKKLFYLKVKQKVVRDHCYIIQAKKNRTRQYFILNFLRIEFQKKW